jgi:hypothetical protein
MQLEKTVQILQSYRPTNLVNLDGHTNHATQIFVKKLTLETAKQIALTYGYLLKTIGATKIQLPSPVGVGSSESMNPWQIHGGTAIGVDGDTSLHTGHPHGRFRTGRRESEQRI